MTSDTDDKESKEPRHQEPTRGLRRIGDVIEIQVRRIGDAIRVLVTLRSKIKILVILNILDVLVTPLKSRFW